MLEIIVSGVGMVSPVPLGCHARGLTVNVGPPSSAYQKQGRSLAQLNIDTNPDPTHTYKHTSNNKRQKALLEYKKDGALGFSDGVT